MKVKEPKMDNLEHEQLCSNCLKPTKEVDDKGNCLVCAIALANK